MGRTSPQVSPPRAFPQEGQPVWQLAAPSPVAGGSWVQSSGSQSGVTADWPGQGARLARRGQRRCSASYIVGTAPQNVSRAEGESRLEMRAGECLGLSSSSLCPGQRTSSRTGLGHRLPGARARRPQATPQPSPQASSPGGHVWSLSKCPGAPWMSASPALVSLAPWWLVCKTVSSVRGPLHLDTESGMVQSLL